MRGTTVTVVLVGEHTCESEWVKYEINRTVQEGNGLLQINIGGIKDFHGNTSSYCGRMIPRGYPTYGWLNDSGYENLGDWIEQAARKAG